MRLDLGSTQNVSSYIDVLKPRETSLLIFIGACSAIIAAAGNLPVNTFILCLIAIGMGSAGCNGLTNYLDREVDSKMIRTRCRAFPSQRITPPQKALPLIIGLIVSALALAWFLHPLCFLSGLIGATASAIWRKTISCTFLGIIAGCSPVLIGWFAIKPALDIQILLLCLMIAFWIPIHVWSVMIASREDYMDAGLNYLPLNLQTKNAVKVLFGLSLSLYLVSIFLYLTTDFHILYLIIANILGILMIYANVRLLLSTASTAAWRVYKLSAFPYLGVIFLTMCLDIWLM